MTPSRQQYIDSYAEQAMLQMKRYGIPASVTLAQAIIESANGQSTLSKTANNHFGIKGTYNGDYVLANDDRPNEKFKKYDDVSQSYEDHSKVLMADRYQKHTKNLSPDDYRGWAQGIKAGGYASDGNYVKTICSVIESCDLQKYDQMVMQQMKKEGRQFGTEQNPLTPSANQTTSTSEKRLLSTGMNLPQGTYSMPVKRDEFLLVTSPYGQRKDPMDRSKTQIHHGIDIKTHKDALLATENNGKVVAVNHNSNTGGGKTVTIEYTRDDGSKMKMQYMHMSDINVKVGDTVNAGEKIGISGNTGTRTTGEHLHFGIIKVTGDGKQQWVNPAAYLAEINAKGNLHIEAQHNGKDLLARYQPTGTVAQTTQTTSNKQSEEQTPEGWMQKLLSSNDSGLGLLGLLSGGEENGESQGLLGSIMQMFTMLLMMAMQNENKTKEEKMQTVTDAVINRKIDISTLVPQLKSAELSIRNDGTTVLSINDGKNSYTHELTEAERTRISQTLNSNADDATKQQRIASVVTAITYSQQASANYDQIESQQQSQQQNIQRK